MVKPTRPSSPGGGSAGDPSRLNRVASRRSSLRFGRNTPGPVLPVGAPPSRALSAGRLAPTGRTGQPRRSRGFHYRLLNPPGRTTTSCRWTTGTWCWPNRRIGPTPKTTRLRVSSPFRSTSVRPESSPCIQILWRVVRPTRSLTSAVCREAPSAVRQSTYETLPKNAAGSSRMGRRWDRLRNGRRPDRAGADLGGFHGQNPRPFRRPASASKWQRFRVPHGPAAARWMAASAPC